MAKIKKGTVGRTRRHVHLMGRIFANDETEVGYPAGTMCVADGYEDGKLLVTINEDGCARINPEEFSPGKGRIDPLESFADRRRRREKARTEEQLVQNIGLAVLEVLEKAGWTPPLDYEREA